MPAHFIQISNASVKFGAYAVPVVPGSLTEYQCQVTQATIQATSNTTTTTVAPTFCGPGSETTVPIASSFALELDWFQDWDVAQATSLSAFMFKHDAEKQAFAMYLNGTSNPVATGIVTVVAGNFAGTPGEPLISGPVTLPIDGYPDIKDTTGASLRGAPSTGATAGIPGAWTPVNSMAPASVADLIAGIPNAVVASPATAWTTGQYVQTRTAGVPGQANWSGSAWVSGPHA